MIKTVTIKKPGTRNITVTFDKKGEEKELVGRIFGDKPGDYKLNVLVDHKVGQTNGRVRIRGIARNGANVAIRGKIKIDPKAQRVDDFLDMRVLILDSKSTATAEPQLEIEADDVKASHAAAIGQIDEEQLFYLMSRGLSRKNSQALIVDGFMNG